MISVIASEPFMVMSERQLDFLKDELDRLEIDSVNTRTNPIGDKNLVRYQLGTYGNEERSPTSTISDGDVYGIVVKLEEEEKGKPDNYEPDYVEGQLDRLAPGTYVQVTRLSPVYMEDGLFGFTYLGTNQAFVRGDLKGKALGLVRDHEVRGHQILGLEEEDTRDATGTHMGEFLPIYNSMRLRNY